MLIASYCLFLHFVADFLLQSREMGKKKSQEFHWLLQHLIIQFFIMYMGCLFVMEPHIAFRLSLLNAVIHGVVDWNIWRGYKYFVFRRLKKETEQFGSTEQEKAAWIVESGKNWQYWEDHWFYTTIGFDQLLHGVTLLCLLGVLL